MHKLKILFMIDALGIGGAEQLLVNLANTLDRERFEVYVCCLIERRGNPLQSELRELGAPLYVLGARRIYDPRTLYTLARYLRRHGIHIVHTQLTDADIVGRIVGRLTGRLVVSTMQNVPFQYSRRRFDRRIMQRLTARFATDRLTAVSRRVRDMFVAEWGVPEHKIAAIYNGVPMDAFFAVPPERPAAPGDGPVITTLGRMTRQKAHADLLRAAKLVLARRPDARFMIAGNGYLMDELQHQAAELGIADRVAFPGMRRDIPQALAESDVFVLSSLWEGLPVSAVEAMAAARPAVMTDVGGCAELVQNGVQGYIVPPRQPEALAEALLKTIEDPARRVAMGIAARERVRHDFDIRTLTAQYEALYEGMWRERHGGQAEPAEAALRKRGVAPRRSR